MEETKKLKCTNCVHRDICLLEEHMKRLNKRINTLTEEFETVAVANFTISIDCKRFSEEKMQRVVDNSDLFSARGINGNSFEPEFHPNSIPR